MSDLILPPWVPVASFARRYIDSTAVSIGEYTGAKITASKGGDRLAASLEFTPQGYSSAGTALNARTVQQFLMRMRGRQNRAYILDPSRRRAGTFPTSELITNNTFAQGLTGWEGANEDIALSVSDRMMRITRINHISGETIRYAGVPVVPFAPYAFRAFMLKGRGEPYWNLRAGTTNGNNDIAEVQANQATGIKTLLVMNTAGSTMFVSLVDWPNGRNIFDYCELPYTSLSRCLLADVGVNGLAYSDQLTQAAWIRENQTPSLVSVAGPLGPATPVSLITEDLANATHGTFNPINISSAINDYCFAVALKAGSRDMAQIIMSPDGVSVAYATVNLTTGALGETGVSGPAFAHLRTPAPMSLGQGWWYVCVIARKMSAQTVMQAYVRPSVSMTGPGGIYTGNGSASMYVWRATLAVSGVPVRLTQTLSSATAGTSPTGSEITVKGAPASGVDLLLPGDQIELNSSRGSELKIVTSPVHSNEMGLAHISFEPPLRGLVGADSPIIVHEPLGYYMVPEQGVEWSREPGTVRASLQVEEAS